MSLISGVSRAPDGAGAGQPSHTVLVAPSTRALSQMRGSQARVLEASGQVRRPGSWVQGSRARPAAQRHRQCPGRGRGGVPGWPRDGGRLQPGPRPPRYSRPHRFPSLSQIHSSLPPSSSRGMELWAGARSLSAAPGPAVVGCGGAAGARSSPFLTRLCFAWL